MTLPDDDLEAIARDRRGRKRGSGMHAFKGPHAKLRRIFAYAKGRATLRKNRTMTAPESAQNGGLS
jgi:hypothetical protein